MYIVCISFEKLITLNNANGDNTINTVNIAYPGYCWIARHCEDVRVAIIARATDRVTRGYLIRLEKHPTRNTLGRIESITAVESSSSRPVVRDGRRSTCCYVDSCIVVVPSKKKIIATTNMTEHDTSNRLRQHDVVIQSLCKIFIQVTRLSHSYRP